MRLLGLTTALAAGYVLLGAPTALAVPPTGIVCTTGAAGAPSFSLTATKGYVDTPDANTVAMWTFANDAPGSLPFQLPSPVLCVNEGDLVTITVRTALPMGANTSLVFPGQENVTASGGVAGALTNEATPTSPVTYTFRASSPGTYLYESGTNPSTQVEMGLYGALVVRSATAGQAYDVARTKYNPSREYLVLMHEIDPAFHSLVDKGLPTDFSLLHFRYWTINGRMFPDTVASNGAGYLPKQPYGSLVRVKPYDPVLNPDPALIRIVNAGLANHPFHPHGFHLRVIAQDGRLLSTPGGADASSEHFGDTVAAGSTQDALFTYVDTDKFCTGTSCTATGYSEKPIPVTLPNYRDLTFKDARTWYSGSPYLGVKGTLPTGVVSYNTCGEFFFPWHSHALNEFVNFDVAFGGLATLLRVDPLPGCTAFAASTKIQATPTPPSSTVVATLAGGTYAALSTGSTYYALSSTKTAYVAVGEPAGSPLFRTDWYAGFTGVAAGATNLKLTYRSKCSAADCTQRLYFKRWRQGDWVLADGPRTIGTGDVTVTDLGPPGAATDYIGTGTVAGQVQVRVYTTRSVGTFVSSGNFMKLVYDAP